MTKSKLNQEAVDLILSLKEEGISSVQIGKRLGVSARTIDKALARIARNGIQPPPETARKPSAPRAVGQPPPDTSPPDKAPRTARKRSHKRKDDPMISDDINKLDNEIAPVAHGAPKAPAIPRQFAREPIFKALGEESLTPQGCQWPMKRGGICGKPLRRRTSWCEHHYEIAHPRSVQKTLIIKHK
jgi:hypothetical protein